MGFYKIHVGQFSTKVSTNKNFGEITRRSPRVQSIRDPSEVTRAILYRLAIKRTLLYKIIGSI